MDAEANEESSTRIITNPDICHGKPVIRGTRIMVWLIVELLANGESIEEILDAYPSLTREDILACLAYRTKKKFRLDRR